MTVAHTYFYIVASIAFGFVYKSVLFCLISCVKASQ